MGSWNPFLGTTSGENYPSYRHVHPNVACAATDSNQGAECKNVLRARQWTRAMLQVCEGQ